MVYDLPDVYFLPGVSIEATVKGIAYKAYGQEVGDLSGIHRHGNSYRHITYLVYHVPSFGSVPFVFMCCGYVGSREWLSRKKLRQRRKINSCYI